MIGIHGSAIIKYHQIPMFLFNFRKRGRRRSQAGGGLFFNIFPLMVSHLFFRSITSEWVVAASCGLVLVLSRMMIGRRSDTLWCGNHWTALSYLLPATIHPSQPHLRHPIKATYRNQSHTTIIILYKYFTTEITIASSWSNNWWWGGEIRKVC